MTPKEQSLKTHQAYAEFIKTFPMTAENLDGEEWRAIDGFNGYQVSTHGRIKTLRNGRNHILKPRLQGWYNYLSVGLVRGSEQRGYSIHRFVAKAFIPNPENKPEVHHRDDNKFNNAVGNLEWVTHAENVQYAYATGVQKSGGDRSYSHLTNEQVEWCRSVYKPHDKEYSMAALAKKLGVEFGIVQLAILGKTYKNAGGKIRGNAWKRLSPETRAEIKRLYVKGSTEFGAVALAKKIGCSRKTITNIVNGK